MAVKPHRVRAALVECFRQLAEWREFVATKFPRDARNRAAAAAFRRLVAHVEALPEGAPILDEFAGIEGLWQRGRFVPPVDPSGQRQFGSAIHLQKFGFVCEPSPAWFLERWLYLLRRDVVRAAKRKVA